jgi:hypothetical protein
MNDREHAIKLNKLNRSHREFYERAETIYQEMVRACPPKELTADRVLEFQREAASIVQRERDYDGSPLHVIRAKPIPEYPRSALKTAIVVAVMQHPPDASDEEICNAVDDAGTLRESGRILTSEYKNRKTRGNLASQISRVRHDLRKTGFSR